MPATQAEALQPVSVSVFTLQSHEIEQNAEWIGRLLGIGRKREWTAEEVLADLKSGQAQLWGASSPEGVAGIWVTRIEDHEGCHVGRVWVAVGSGLKYGLELFRQYTEPWLLACCSRIEIEGRKGWERALPDYKREGALLVKHGR